MRLLIVLNLNANTITKLKTIRIHQFLETFAEILFFSGMKNHTERWIQL